MNIFLDLVLQAGLNAEDRNNLFNTYFSQVRESICIVYRVERRKRINIKHIFIPQALNQVRNGNLVSSPASVKAVLTMLVEGAGGDTKTEIISALRLPEDESRRKEVTQRVLMSLKVDRETSTNL